MALVAAAALGAAFLEAEALAGFEAALVEALALETVLPLLEGLVASALLAVLALRGLETCAGASAAMARTDLRYSTLMMATVGRSKGWRGARDRLVWGDRAEPSYVPAAYIPPKRVCVTWTRSRVR